MKKLLSTAFVAFLPLIAMAQTQELPKVTSGKLKEIGLATNGLFNDSYGLVYRTGTQKALWRFNSIFASGVENNRNANISNPFLEKQSYHSLGFGVGREYRKPIAKNFELRYGVDINFSYHTKNNLSTSNYNIDNISNDKFTSKGRGYRTGLNFVVGTNYLLGEQIAVGIELNPSIGIGRGKETLKFTNSNGDVRQVKQNISSFYYGISGSSVLFSIVYKFQ